MLNRLYNFTSSCKTSWYIYEFLQSCMNVAKVYFKKMVEKCPF